MNKKMNSKKNQKKNHKKKMNQKKNQKKKKNQKMNQKKNQKKNQKYFPNNHRNTYLLSPVDLWPAYSDLENIGLRLTHCSDDQ